MRNRILLLLAIGSIACGRTSTRSMFLADAEAERTSCSTGDDCGEGEACIKERCSTTCCDSTQCGEGYECIGSACRPPSNIPPTLPLGWIDPPGSGETFAVHTLTAIRTGGFDVDPVCGEAPSIDNHLGGHPSLGRYSALMQMAVSGRDTLALEIAGAHPLSDRRLSPTLKLYTAVVEERTGGIPSEIAFKGSSLTGIPPNATAKTPALLEAPELTTLAPVPASLPVFSTIWLNVEKLSARLRVEPRGDETNRLTIEGVLGGAVSALQLAAIPAVGCAEPPCRGSALVEIVQHLGSPDVDFDGDGLEEILLDGDGNVTRCIDGDGRELPPAGPGCELLVVDGYSFAAFVRASKATVTGIARE